MKHLILFIKKVYSVNSFFLPLGSHKQYMKAQPCPVQHTGINAWKKSALFA